MSKTHHFPYGITMNMRPGVSRPDQAQAPAVWVVYVPDEDPETFPTRDQAVQFISRVVGRRLSRQVPQ